jgi:hypothetical protein
MWKFFAVITGFYWIFASVASFRTDDMSVRVTLLVIGVILTMATMIMEDMDI